jgi:hypothetical protein
MLLAVNAQKHVLERLQIIKPVLPPNNNSGKKSNYKVVLKRTVFEKSEKATLEFSC